MKPAVFIETDKTAGGNHRAVRYHPFGKVGWIAIVAQVPVIWERDLRRGGVMEFDPVI